VKKKIIVLTLFIIWSGVVFSSGLKIGINGSELKYQEDQQRKPNYTGQQVQDAVNAYRKELKLRELKTDDFLCNDIFDRYSKMLSGEALTTGHPGFEEWANMKLNKYNFSLVGEVFSPYPTVEEVLNGWKGSPGHNDAITKKEYSSVCTYAGEKGVVLVLGAK